MPRMLVVMVVIMGCRAAQQSPPTSAAAPADQHQVAISGFAFHPDTLTIPVGATVTWTNRDMTLHQVWSVAVADTFRSGRLSVYGTFSHTFKVAGVFPYLCPPHPGMQAVIVVK